MIGSVAASLVQFAPGRPSANLKVILGQIRAAARADRPRLVVFPELALSGFPVRDVVATERLGHSERLDRIDRTARSAGVYAVAGFAELAEDGAVHNSAALFTPDGLASVVRKQRLPGREQRWFAPGGPPAVTVTGIGAIGIAICYDAWFPEYVKSQARQGAEIIVNINSIWGGGSAGGIGGARVKGRYWRVVPVARALDTQAYVLACNGSGSHDFGDSAGVWRRLGRSRVVDPAGRVVATAPTEGDAVVTATLTAAAVDRARRAIHLLADSAGTTSGVPAGGPAPGNGTYTTEREQT
ncbi:carbon-nitrogen hydrolase family protein [Solwaraspora sp. WMMB335]|uniref:carbon-nitrogen hydrolase family protein n=1 Tax=Solwaraspora sp. WMMB335 TaxID=3404118 RepID=UPI003B95229F